jgi:hypothetical protein
MGKAPGMGRETRGRGTANKNKKRRSFRRKVEYETKYEYGNLLVALPGGPFPSTKP